MENQNNGIQEIKHKSNNRWMYVTLAILALGIIGLSIYMLSIKKELSGLVAEKESQRVELVEELNSLLVEHEKIKTSYGEISDSLTVIDSVIQSNAKEIKSLLNYKWEYYKIKKKISRLQVVSQQYVRQMDSLYKENTVLTEENLQMKEEIQIERKRNQNLSKEKEKLSGKVEEASILGIYNIDANAVRVKGSGNETVTNKIRRTDRLKVCFTLGENSIVAAGKKSIYVRIAQPDKEILAKGRGDQYTFEHKGEMLQYTMKKDIDYQNESIDICLSWNKRQTVELQPGVYHVDIFDGNTNIGHSTFELK
jgi:ribosomal protein L17